MATSTAMTTKDKLKAAAGPSARDKQLIDSWKQSAALSNEELEAL